MEPAQDPNQKILIQYLLGDSLPDAEVERVEELYFDDSNYLDRLAHLEDDLIDAYIDGRLSPHDRAQFETHFLASARRREKWEAQQAIATFFRTSTPPAPFLTALSRFLKSQTFGVRVAMAAAGLVLAAGLGVLGAGYLRFQEQAGALQAHVAELERGAAREPAIAAFLLEPGMVRSGEGNRLRVAAGTEWVVLRLELPEAAPADTAYVVTLSTPEGEELWRQGRLRPMGAKLELRLPGSLLSRGDYVVSVAARLGSKQTDLPSYVFHVE
jgi:anti-sigma factor RsiW